MRTNALVQRTAELFFYGQPPMAAFYHACVEFLADEMACDKRRPRATPEQVADKRAADVQLTRQLVLDGLKRAAASPDVDDPEHDRDRAGEARILAYKLPPYGVPAYWERGDQYPRVDEVDVSAAPVRAERLPSPIKKLILSRVRI